MYHLKDLSVDSLESDERSVTTEDVNFSQIYLPFVSRETVGYDRTEVCLSPDQRYHRRSDLD